MMGSRDDQGKDDERPQHLVRITRDFYLGKVSVTQEQFQAILGSNPSRFALTKRHPVDNVSWQAAGEFCRKLKAAPAERTHRFGSKPAGARLRRPAHGGRVGVCLPSGNSDSLFVRQ